MRILVVTNMYPTPDDPGFGTFVADQVQAIRAQGVDVDVLLINGRKSRLDYLRGVVRLRRALRRERYDLIHAHYSLSGFVARAQFRCPVVVTYHGTEVRDHAPAWLRIPSRRGTAIFDRVIAVSDRQKDLMRGDPRRVEVIPCGVDLELFHPIPRERARAELGLPHGQPLVLWAGEYWQAEKNFPLVEASMEELRKAMPDAGLILVSGRPHEVVPLYMSACDVLLLLSVAEGSPMVVKEAMACNLPVVATAVGDIAQVIDGARHCHLVAPDPGDVARTLQRVLETRERSDGRDHIQHLSGSTIARRVVAVYERVIAESRRASAG